MLEIFIVGAPLALGFVLGASMTFMPTTSLYMPKNLVPYMMALGMLLGVIGGGFFLAAHPDIVGVNVLVPFIIFPTMAIALLWIGYTVGVAGAIIITLVFARW